MVYCTLYCPLCTSVSSWLTHNHENIYCCTPQRLEKCYHVHTKMTLPLNLLSLLTRVCFWTFYFFIIIFITRTVGAAGPLVLECGGSVFFFVFFVFVFLYFTTPIFVPIRQFFNFTTIFTTNVYHRFYHKFLPQTTTINHYHNWGVNIYYHNNFCSNPTIFQFYHKFYHTFLPHILPQILPQTTTTNHYHNWGVNIYYHTNFCSNLTIFQFYHIFYYTCYHKFYHKLLPLSPRPPTMFSVPKRNTYKCFERPAKIFIASNYVDSPLAENKSKHCFF